MRFDNFAVVAVFVMSVVAAGGALAAEKPIRLNCPTVGDVPKSDGAGGWVCADDIDTTDTDWNNLTNVPADIALRPGVVFCRSTMNGR